ncbi:hypothetical protein GQ600_7895 [Phytophthora cactorum]|nr:hypothetical protein GQ600_7895 [Phytophthora cactorum]
MKAVCLWDNRPVQLLSTGGSIDPDRVARREKSGEQAEVACPRILKNYQSFMGGVDVHGQFRLQRQVQLSCMYRVCWRLTRIIHVTQLALKYKKYYKSLFLGFIDLAISGNREFFYRVQSVSKADWEEVCRTNRTPTKAKKRGPPALIVQELVYVDEWRNGNNGQGRKRRQRTCKVCSKLKRSGVAKGGDTSYYCRTCKPLMSSKKPMASRVQLCNKIKHKVDGKELSCYDIWHTKWASGSNIPPSKDKNRIRARTPGAAGSRGARSASVGASGDDVGQQ